MGKVQFTLEGVDMDFKSAVVRFEALVVGKCSENFSGGQPS
jgi:hypothetical protein